MTDNVSSVDTQPRIRRRSRPEGEIITPPEPIADAEGYEVGYGKPPKEHRFKAGQSGNPKGRPKGARGINAMVREMLDEKTDLVLRGKRRKVRLIKALLLKQLDLASKGDWRAMAELIKYYRAAVPDQANQPMPAAGDGSTASDADDDAILAAYRAMVVAEALGERGDRG